MEGQRKFPTKEELLGIIDRLKDLTQEEKDNLRKSFERRAMDAQQAQEALKGKSKYFQITSYEYFVFLLTVAIVLLVFGFFGYKLYRSLMDRELKQKNKKSKQQKKTAPQAQPTTPKEQTKKEK